MALTRHTDMTRQREPHGQRRTQASSVAEPVRKETGNKKPNSTSPRGSGSGAKGRSTPVSHRADGAHTVDVLTVIALVRARVIRVYPAEK